MSPSRVAKLRLVASHLLNQAAATLLFDHAYTAWRGQGRPVMPDNLHYYTAALSSIQLGDPPTSWTLTPSPYFLDFPMSPLALAE